MSKLNAGSAATEIVNSASRRLTLADLNKRNRAFWRDRARREQKLILDVDLACAASDLINADRARNLPIGRELQWLEALEAAAMVRSRFHNFDAPRDRMASELARMGGLAQKADPLQNLIEALVQKRPNMSERELRRELELRQHAGVILDVEATKIVFQLRNGAIKKARLSGLKDRLSRAKKKFRSR